MSLLPERLRVKRKRDDDPVDALFLQASEHSFKRRITLASAQQYVFRRLKEERIPVPDQHNAVPRVISTKPGEEIGFFDQPRQGGASSRLCHSLQQDGRHQSLPRRYHLSKTMDKPSSSSVIGTGQGGLVQNIAVLVEDRQKQKTNLETCDNPRMQESRLDGEATQRKRRPSANSVRNSLSREDNEGQRNPCGEGSKHADRRKQAQLQDAMERFAMEYRDTEASDRPQLTSPNDEAAKGDVEMTEDDDYVYDTYVRYPVITASSGMNETMVNQNSNVGYIMLEEGDEGWWEKYVDDMDSDDDWNSEQDDENAENFYGADYPDEDLASDDEHGFDAYKFRHGGASDEEEFGSDWDEWSNNGYNDQYPWNSNVGRANRLRQDGVEE